MLDLLSRDFINETVDENPSMLEVVYNIQAIVNISLEKKIQFQKETIKDEILSLIKECCMNGWSHNYIKNNKKLMAFKNVKDDLTVIEDILLYNNRG